MAGLELARAGLAELAGLAPSPVLDARLDRAAVLIDAITAPPSLNDPGWAALLDAATVQETQLFRAPRQMQRLADALPAQLAAARAEGRPLRILSAGCATGEEVFTLAAIAQQASLDAAPGTVIEVVGLDICRPALASAEQGRIGPHLGAPLASVPVRYLPWLAGPGGAPHPHAALRRAARFRRATLLAPPDELGGFDVILCRNVLIYMTDPARARVVDALSRHLRPGGVLGLGPTDDTPAAPFARLGEGLYRHG